VFLYCVFAVVLFVFDYKRSFPDNSMHLKHYPTTAVPCDLYANEFQSSRMSYTCDVNCENRLLTAEYCHGGDDWPTNGYFSATGALLLCY